MSGSPLEAHSRARREGADPRPTEDRERSVGMSYVQGLRCRECGREYEVAPIFTCEWCFGPLEVSYDYDAISAATSRERIAAGPRSVWRYADLLPVDYSHAVDLGA